MIPRPPGRFSGRLVRQAGLLLTLGASLVGFFLLLNLLVPLISTGPQDILAVNPSTEEEIRLPTGVAFLTFGVMALSIVLGIGALLVLHGRPLQREGGHPSTRLLPGVLVAVGLIGLGGYLAFSGILGQDISYEQHQAQRLFLQPAGVAVLAGFFLSVAIAAVLNARLLLPVLVGWLTIGIVFGFFNTQSLDGLKLFEKTSRLEEPAEYSAIVDRYLRPEEAGKVDGEAPTSPELNPLDTWVAPGASPRLPEGPYMSLDPGLTAEQTPRLAHEPVFRVTGAANTSYLRAATGDIYANRRWTQLDPVHIPAYAKEEVPRAVASFVSRFARMQAGQTGTPLNLAVLQPPTSSPPEVTKGLIAVSPAGEIVGFVDGALAISQNLRTIDVNATYRPFSATVSIDHALTSYSWESSVPAYSPDELIQASPIDDPTYLQLPEDLPRRIYDLAAEIATEESAYLRARAIEEYLREHYTSAFALPGSEPARPPSDQDPVDWFLFDHGQGSHGNFSTAFVVLARAASVPARVVSGWAISPLQQQTVHWDQAHQWAEIALEGLGWITFDPTPPESLGDKPPLSDKAPLEEEKEDGAAPREQELAPKKEPVTEEEVEAALEELMTSEDPEVQLFVLEVLGESTDPEALRILVETLVDEGYVVDELTGIEKIQALDLGLLIWVLLNYEEPVIRVAAADALGKLGDLEALDALSQALASDLVPKVRAAAAAALAELGDALASEPLVQSLESDGDGMVRAAAAQALGELKAPGTAEILIKALGADPDERVRAATARALGQIRDEAALSPLLQAEKHDEMRAVREAARDALTAWPAFSLIATLQTSSLPETRAVAAEILGRLGHAPAIPALSGALGDQEEAVRSAALEALRLLGTMHPLENGGALLFRGQTALAFIPGATTAVAPEGPVIAAFNVDGAAGIKLLRTATGDHYEDGGWIAEGSIGQPHRSIGQAFDHSRALAQPDQGPRTLVSILLSMPASMTLLGGTVPTSSQLSFMSIPGVFWPASAVYTIRTSTARDYSWTSLIYDYSEAELEAIRTVPSELHTSLPDDLPQRVRDLAAEITAGHSTPYRQAAAIEQYLKENYTYAQPDADPGGPPEGHDPVDWFLFETGTGTSGNFSSAFVLLARSVGIPARVVSGWAIAPIAVSQEVYSDQAHQWAEVPFQDRGWIAFDPTPGGAPARAIARLGSLDPEVRADVLKEQLEQLAGGDEAASAAARGLLDALLQSAHGQYPSLLQDLSSATLLVSRETEALRLLNDLLRSLGRQSTGHTPFTLASLEALSRELSGLEPETRDRALSASAKLLESLSSDRPTAPARAREGLVDLLELLEASEVAVQLENGGLVIRQGRGGGGGGGGGQGYTFSVGTTAYQAAEPPLIPWFEVRGAANTAYLRTGVGDIYEDGRWAQHDPVSISYPAGGDTYDLLLGVFYTSERDTLPLPSGPFEPALLFGPQAAPLITTRDQIRVLPTGDATRLPLGPIATSLTVQSIDRPAVFHPYSATFSSETSLSSYSWFSSVSTYSDQQLARAEAVYGLAYTDLPNDLPGRIRTLAQSITGEHATAYGKAKALERYLSTQYTYRFARTPEEGRPPPGRDPVDWFLFDHREGTCGVFSSAFVVLARSIGLPARVVSGWAIAPTADTQIVYVGQAHQWAEVAFEGLGWVSFEPTASGGAPSRVADQFDNTKDEGEDTNGETLELVTEGPEPPQETVTDITQSPTEISRGRQFSVRGTVHTAGGLPVTGLTIEVYVNETKEHGGTKIGTAVTRFGSFHASAEIPTDLELGSYQLLARAVGNEDFNESWSDPDITVFSASGLELTGPAEVPVDVDAVFHGRVTDDTGEGVADRQVNVTVDGRVRPAVTTGSTGSFSLSMTFSDPGRHWVAVELQGQEYLLDNQVRLDFQVTLPTSITLLVPALVSVSEDFTVTGELQDARGTPLSGEYVSVEVGGNPAIRTLTDGSGAFQVDGRVDTAGEFVVHAEFSGLAPTLPSEKTARLTARHTVSLSLSGPSQIDTGSGALFTGRLTSDTLSPIGELELSMEDGDGRHLATVTTDENGRFEYSHASFDITGPQSLTARFAGGEFVAPRSARVNFGVVSPTTLNVEGPLIQRDGESLEPTGLLIQGTGAVFTGRLASDTVSPIGRRELTIRDGSGLELAKVTTTEDGFFEYRHPSFDIAGPHSLTVRFPGTESLAPQSAGIAFGVLAPTTLTIEEPTIVSSGEPSQLTGFLLQGSGALFTGSLASETVSPIGPRELSIRNADGRKLATMTTTEDGAFEYTHPNFETTGPHALSIEFSGAESLAPQSAQITFGVLAPTTLNIEELGIVQAGRPFELTGVLQRDDGRAVPDATVLVRGDEPSVLVTDANGAFTLEATETVSDSPSGASFESTREVEFVFEGTEHLAPATAGTKITVGVPRIVMEPVETVARGDSVQLRGTALLGTSPIPDLQVKIGGNTTVSTNQAGTFGYAYPVTENAPLGLTEVDIAAASINATATTAFEVKSRPSLIVTPLDKVRPGRVAMLQVTLLDDTGAGIPRAPFRTNQGVQAVTDAEGVALMDLTVPDSYELPSVPVTFEYDGDDLNMPLSYFLGVPVTPGQFNWLLWLGAPVAILLVGAAAIAVRRVGDVSLPEIVRRAAAARTPVPEPVVVEEPEGLDEEEPVAVLLPAQLAIRFIKPADDLPDVLGIGEELGIDIGVADPEGQGIAKATVAVSVSREEEATELTTDNEGRCALRWTATELGEYAVRATFAGNDECLEAFETRNLRVVDFREEIVRLYNEFLDWAESKTTAISDQSTPREVELTLVDAGLHVDQKSLDELISRFEEADYSEHPIARRHYERMYRAWHTIVRC